MYSHLRKCQLPSVLPRWTFFVFSSTFKKWKWSNFLSKIAQFSRKSTFLHLLLQSIKKIEGKIDQKFFYHQLEQQKLFNLITNFMQIGPSKAKICSNLWKMSKLPLKISCNLTLIPFHLWNALKSQQIKIKTCGLHH